MLIHEVMCHSMQNSEYKPPNFLGALFFLTNAHRKPPPPPQLFDAYDAPANKYSLQVL
jgi:hypothetical protein